MTADAMRQDEFPDGDYTYADFLEWPDDLRAEIIDGQVFMMAPPLDYHQLISMELCYRIRSFLDGKPCKVFSAPYSVRLFPRADKTDDTVVEPDIVVICDQSKRDKYGCNGAPDMIIEILSPSTSRHDQLVKYNKYLKAGVKEYWMVNPETKGVQVCILEG
ncbi:MAG: Uma2 family endonuclease, partial [Spirochaetales bacterium]|nr:Uma2 family endonuclease [Spirochaetales bacterium]